MYEAKRRTCERIHGVHISVAIGNLDSSDVPPYG